MNWIRRLKDGRPKYLCNLLNKIVVQGNITKWDERDEYIM